MDKNIIYGEFDENTEIIYVEERQFDEDVSQTSDKIVLHSVSQDDPYSSAYEYIQFEPGTDDRFLQEYQRPSQSQQSLNDRNLAVNNKTNVNDYICGSCDDSFSKRSDLDTHLQNKHPEIYNIINSYKKAEVQLQSKKEKKINFDDQRVTEVLIMKTECEKYGEFICKCGEIYNRFLELEQHVHEFHSEELEEPTANVENVVQEIYVQNIIAEEEDSSQEGRGDHFDNTEIVLQQSEEEKNTKEEFLVDSNTSFVTMDELISKKVAGSKGVPIARGGHVCSHCGTKFWLKKNFVNHMRENHPDKPEFICDICSKGFFDHLQLKEHKRIHDIKKFVCDICSKGIF